MNQDISKEELKKKFSKYSHGYSYKVSQYHKLRRKKIIWKSLSNLEKEKRRRKKFIEIGIGDGFFFLEIAHLFEFSLGIDIAPGMIKEAKKNLKTNQNIKLMIGDIEEGIKIKKKANFFLISEVLQYTKSHKKCINNISKLIAPEGILLIINWSSRYSFLQRFRRIIRYGVQDSKEVNYPNSKDLINNLKKEGFYNIQLMPVTFFPFVPKSLSKLVNMLDNFLSSFPIARFSAIYAIIAKK